MRLLEACLKALSARLGEDPLVVQDVRVGVFYTAVALITGHVGVAFTPRGLSDTVCCPRSAAAAPPAGRLGGQDAWKLVAEVRSPVALRRAVGVATLNALSALAMDRFGVPGGVRIPGLDALEAAGVSGEDRVVLVGAFSPFIKSLKGTVSALWVIDRHPEALREEERVLWRPPEGAAEVLREATVVVITGSSLVEGGLDELLDSCRGARRVVLAGPTASPWPEPFFQRGVHILGGILVLDGPRLVRIVGEGGSGYFFQEAAEKVCLVREDVAPSLPGVREACAQDAAPRS
ncbi:MAG: DUF364 domain-containing protein [Armatimonadota bacterium]|nr:DUF364 domain-containing protein [Armatimonadota bacterium]